MALSDYERLKRWRAKHPVLANRRRKEYRKSKAKPEVEIVAPIVEAPKSKIEELRALIATESAKPAEPIPTKPIIFKNDFGNVITESQWNQLQKRKANAKAGGYVIDEFSQ